MSSGRLVYLYCITERETAARELLEAGAISGLFPGEPLFAVTYNNLMAAVSLVPEEAFHQDRLNELFQDINRIAPFAVRHEEAIRMVAARAPAVVPITMGAVYRTEEGVVDLLTRNAERLGRLLEQVRYKQEWGVKVFQQPRRIVAGLQESSPKLLQLEEEVQRSTPGRAYMLKKRQERMVVEEANRLTAATLSEVQHCLEAQSAAVALDEVVSSGEEDLALAMKAACLVPVDGAAAFRTEVERLNERYEPRGFTVEADGPWAPYSFVGGRDGLV